MLEPPQVGDTETLKCHSHPMHLGDTGLLLGGVADVRAGSANCFSLPHWLMDCMIVLLFFLEIEKHRSLLPFAWANDFAIT